MPNYFARANGNINATNVWATTPTGTAAAQTFVAGDVLYANNFAITVNVDTNLGSTGEVRNDNTNGATAGGSFTLSNGVTLTANVFAGSTGASCVIFSGVVGNSATIVGNCTGGSGSNANGANNNSTGTLSIVGNCTGGSAGSANGANNNSTGTLSIVGNCTGGSAGSAFGANNSSTGTLSITGNATGGSAGNAFGANNSSTGTLSITGNCTGGSASSAFGANNSSTGTLTITGNCTGGSAGNAIGANNSSTGTLSITGNCTGGSGSSAFGANNSSTGTLSIVGSAFGSNNAFGANNASTGILNVTRAVGNDWGINSTGMVSVAGVNSAVAGSQTRVEEFEFGLRGQAPVTGAVSTPDVTSNVCIVHRLGTTKKTLSDPSASTGQANQADVRFGTSYALGNRTGTLRVPAAGSVALGVLVDNTTGTAVLTPSAVWDALTSSMTTSGSIGARLKNAATLDSTGQQLADALSPVP